jgi:hypothetical protein
MVGKTDFVYIALADEYRCPADERAVHRFATLEKGLTMEISWSSACPGCPMRAHCTTSNYRRIRRWEHEGVLERVQQRLDRKSDAMAQRKSTVEHVFGTLKHWMGSTHFLTEILPRVATEMSLHVLASEPASGVYAPVELRSVCHARAELARYPTTARSLHRVVGRASGSR